MDTNITTIFLEASQSLGLLFYLVPPSSSSYREVEDCPDLVARAMPFMVLLMVLEGLVNTFHRRKEHNLADSITSISFGLLMTLAGLATRVLMVEVYYRVHRDYSLVVLAWDSPLTWLVTALLLDLGYYGFHRASHEVGVLWSVHQVHHSSQYFNLTTAFRQPILEGLGWMTHWFYLPLALAIPTPMMLVHAELNFLYQFWIHTELVGDLGPLGLVLNTASHHRVHHGANRYCLDKNYGGFLSVWDRLFGTFQEERQGETIAYGLVDQPRFFDVVKHTTFYFGLTADKASSCTSWGDRVRAWVWGPGWFPGLGLARLGDNMAVEEVPDRPVHKSPLPLPGQLVLVLQLLAVVAVHDHLTLGWKELSGLSSLPPLLFVVWTLVSIGLQLDCSAWALTVETTRVCSCFLVLLATPSTSSFSSSTSSFSSTLLLLSLLPAQASVLYYSGKIQKKML